MRVNVDEKAFNDPRMARLTELMCWSSVDLAVGAMVRLWLAALNRVTEDNPRGLLPREDADYATSHRDLVKCLLTVGLAVEVEGMIYLRGLEERGGFLLLQRRKGARGGKARVRAERRGKQMLKPMLEPMLEQRLKPEQECGLSLTSGSGSGSGSGSLKNLSVSASLPTVLERLPEIYAEYPRKVGKTDGMRVLAKSVITDDDFDACMRAVRNFAREHAGQEAKFIRHFDRWARTWRDWVDGVKQQPLASSSAQQPQRYVTPVVENAVNGDELRSMAHGLLQSMRSKAGDK